MMRALWTAGSGMMAQQFNVDVISNNLANVNTTGYKTERAEFKDLLYDTLDRASVLDGTGKPINLQVGHGTAVVATMRDYGNGNPEKTDNPFDFSIDGEAFFTLQGPKGDVVYTRDGSFKISVTDSGNKLTTASGDPVLDDAGSEIIIPAEIDISKLAVNTDGSMGYVDNTGTTVSLDQKLGLVKFPNRFALENIGNNQYAKNSASGEPIADGEQGQKSTVIQGYLESSNVQVVKEMVKLIIAQRAYEVNSKAIQSADEMLGQANGLKR